MIYLQTLSDLGYNQKFEQFRLEQKLNDFEIGRIIAEHKERYVVKTADGEYDAEITGNMRFAALGREDFPAVGDWVALMVYDGDMAIIHRIFPRFSVIKRQAVGQSGDVQIIGANIDYAFLVQAVDRDFNINRLERYLTICNSSKVSPVIVLSKTDLIDKTRLDEILEEIKKRVASIPVLAISNQDQSGYEQLKKFIEKGKTYCLLGSSGVGKSTLLNNLSGRDIMKTDSISQSSNRGRHVTSHRELIVLENGGILIDNPGMREVGVTDVSEGLEITFDKIFEFAADCKYDDCTHTTETGCAVLNALENGEIDSESYQNYLKLQKEKNYFETTAAERKKKEKIFGKIVKDYYKKGIKHKN